MYNHTKSFFQLYCVVIHSCLAFKEKIDAKLTIFMLVLEFYGPSGVDIDNGSYYFTTSSSTQVRLTLNRPRWQLMITDDDFTKYTFSSQLLLLPDSENYTAGQGGPTA